MRNSIISAGAEIEKNAVIDHAIIDENVKVGKGAKIGAEQKGSSLSIAVLGRDITVSDNAVVEAGKIIDENV